MNYTIPWTVAELGTKTRKFEVNLHVFNKIIRDYPDSTMTGFFLIMLFSIKYSKLSVSLKTIHYVLLK